MKTTKIDQMTPEEIRRHGRELMRLAAKKEQEQQNNLLISIGQVFKREIECGWPTPWEQLSSELESMLGIQPTFPGWGLTAGVQGGAQAPLAAVEISEVENESQ